MYRRFVRSESWLVVVEMVTFTNELMDTMSKISFSNILEQMGKWDTGW